MPDHAAALGARGWHSFLSPVRVPPSAPSLIPAVARRGRGAMRPGVGGGGALALAPAPSQQRDRRVQRGAPPLPLRAQRSDARFP